MNTEDKPELDGTTEQKIKAAAKKLFTQKGYSAVKTREIAAEAGINLALLNYYFRSKEKLFELVMADNFITFVDGASHIINNETTTFDKKVELLAAHYIDILIENPDVPRFVLNEIQNHPEKLAKAMSAKLDIFNSIIMKQLSEEIQKGNMMPVNRIHFMINIIGLAVFPFAAKPLLVKVGQINESTFVALLEERKLLIPIWIKNMYKPKEMN